MSPATGVGYALNLGPLLTRVVRAVDAAACAHEYRIGIGLIDMNREDVRVVDHTLFPGGSPFPVLAAVCRLPGKVPGSDIDRIGIPRVDGDRVKSSELRIPFRRDSSPRLAAVPRTIDTVAGGDSKRVSLANRLHHA